MRVADWMHKNPITVDADAGISEAWRLMRRNRIRHLPVRDKGKLVGILTDRDLRLAYPSRASSLEPHERLELWGHVRVWEVMTRVLVTAAPEMELEEAVQLLLRFKIGGLPVVRYGKLVGMLTKTDLLRALADYLRPSRPRKKRD